MENKREGAKVINTLWGLALCILSAGIVIASLIALSRAVQQQADELSSAKLQEVSAQMQKTLDDSKIMLLRFASDVEVFVERGVDQGKLQSYLKSQSRIFRDQSRNTFMNAFICTSDWILISDSPVPENYVITKRGWYSATIQSGIDNIYTTSPYVDAFTGGMCFTSTLLLSDGKTIVGIDFDLSKIQESVVQMNSGGDGEALIVSRDGIVVGYTDKDLAGKKLEEVLPGFVDVYERLLREQNDSLILESVIGGQSRKVFCNRSGEWLFLYIANRSEGFWRAYQRVWIGLALNLLLLGAMFLFFLSARKSRRQAEEALKERESFLDNLSAKMRDPLTKIMSISETTNEDGGQNAVMRLIRDSAGTLSDMMDNLLSYKEVKQEREETEKKSQSKKQMFVLTKGARNGIMTVMLVTVAVAIIFTGIVLAGWGNDRMEREVDSYNYQLVNWTNMQLQTMNMFVDTIAANPSVLDDYDFAVEYLDRIVRNYSEISAAYIARPGNAHEMTMNNGWVPNADYIVAERQWYVDTQNSETGINISAPYLDARTGLYCVTFSRIVISAETGEQIGIFALDFYIGNLTNIMESSYSSSGYAFLVDNSNVIVNHPNAEYQISSDKGTNIKGTEYEALLDNSKIHFIRDYDGKLKVCISRTEDVTGFTVISVKDAGVVYGIVLLTGGAFTILLAVCIVLLYQLIMRMIRWQEEVRQTLTEEAERAARADRAKSSFLAQMSHEIRTPINAVLGMNEMILRESKEDVVLEYASNAYNAGKALLSTINDILDISKIEAGKLEIVEADYEMYSLVSDCYHMTADRAEKKGLAFHYIVDGGLPAKLSGDMFHIRQIVVNFLTNAIKYTDEGSVELSFSGVRTEAGFALQVAVKDTGIGLTEESLEKLFTSFQRFDLKRNQSVEGTGLGLSICKQLAELMGGSVEVESVYGQGSTFRCTIPQTVVDDAPVGKLVLNRPMERREQVDGRYFTARDAHILVVDDVEMNLVVFTSLLKGHEFAIETATSGKQCLEMVQRQKYDVIFMDHMMPEMDGMETFARMGNMEHLNHDTPVVMLTANAISGEKEKYMSAGFSSYLTKPIQSDKLEEILIQYLPQEKIKWQEENTKQGEESADGGVDVLDMQKICGDTALFDVGLGIHYSGDDRGSYRTILSSYVRDGQKKTERIRSLYGQEAWKDYVTEVHALKSTSLAVGSVRLSEAAKELELAGKEGNYQLIHDKNEELLAMYQSVLGMGKKVLEQLNGAAPDGAGASQAEKAELEKEQLAEYAKRLQAAADGFDSEQILALCEELSGYQYEGVDLGERIQEIREAAEDFEYELVGERAQQLFEKLQ